MKSRHLALKALAVLVIGGVTMLRSGVAQAASPESCDLTYECVFNCTDDPGFCTGNNCTRNCIENSTTWQCPSPFVLVCDQPI